MPDKNNSVYTHSNDTMIAIPLANGNTENLAVRNIKSVEARGSSGLPQNPALPYRIVITHHRGRKTALVLPSELQAIQLRRIVNEMKEQICRRICRGDENAR